MSDTALAGAGDMTLPTLPALADRDDQVKLVLSPEQVAQAAALSGKTKLRTLDGTVVVLYGQEPIAAFKTLLDQLLGELNKGDNPVLFELFRQIRDGANKMELGELEGKIREKLKGGFFARLLMAVGLQDKAKFLQDATNEVRGMLQGKSKTLLALIQPMEVQIEAESRKLIDQVRRNQRLAEGYKVSMGSLAIHIEAGRAILAEGEAEYAALKERAEATQDPLTIAEAKDFAQRVELFRNRLLVLETAYVKSPVDRESIGIAQGATLNTLADTVSSSTAEFNDIKSMLIRLAALLSIKSVQELNSLRRELRAKLQAYGLDLLEDTAVTAAGVQSKAALDAAQLVRISGDRLKVIAGKIAEQERLNESRRIEARTALEAARRAVADL